MPAETIDHVVVTVRESAKPKLLRARSTRPSVLVLVHPQRAKSVSYGLQKRGLEVELLHGDKKQGGERALDRFRSGEAAVLVATDRLRRPRRRGRDVRPQLRRADRSGHLRPPHRTHGRGARRRRVRLRRACDLQLRAIEHRIGERIQRAEILGFAVLDVEELSGDRRRRGAPTPALTTLTNGRRSGGGTEDHDPRRIRCPAKGDRARRAPPREPRPARCRAISTGAPR